MIVLDASVLIAHLDSADPHHARAQSLLEASGAEAFGASAITLAETLVSPARAGRLSDAEAALRRLGVSELELGENAPGRLAQLRTDVGMKLPDCCVLLAAQEHGGIVASFDADLLAAARKLGVGNGAIGPAPTSPSMRARQMQDISGKELVAAEQLGRAAGYLHPAEIAREIRGLDVIFAPRPGTRRRRNWRLVTYEPY